MLTSFFSKSKPINFTVAVVYMLVFYMLVGVQNIFSQSFLGILRETGVFILLLLSLILVNFVAKRNELTSRNAYKTILFAGFVSMLVQTLQNDEVIIANFFVLLAFRRIISLRSQRETIQKVFDATFWILVASLFYFWSVLFLLVVFVGILLYSGLNLKTLLVPAVAFLILLSLVTTGDLLFNDSFYTIQDWYQASNFDFLAYREPSNLIPVAFLLALTLWSSFFFMVVIQKAGSNLKASLLLVFVTLQAALFLAIMAPTKDTSELLFFLAPLAIMVTNYFQMLHDKWFREILLGVIILLPVVILIWF